MSQCTVELATKANETYDALHEAATTGKSSGEHADLLKAVDGLIEIIEREPFSCQLSGQFQNTFWITDGRVRIYYEKCERPDIVVITRIATKIRPVDTLRSAEAILEQMALNGHLNPLLVKAGIRVIRSTSVN